MGRTQSKDDMCIEPIFSAISHRYAVAWRVQKLKDRILAGFVNLT